MAGGGARISSIGGHSWPPPDDKLDSIFSFLFFSFLFFFGVLYFSSPSTANK